jgi:hypothetical protein
MGFIEEMLMLTKEELLALYPVREKLAEKNRKVVEKVYNENRFGFHPLVNSVLQSGLELGKLVIRKTFGRYCPVCKTSGGYVKFKSGPRKGCDNTKRPLLISGYYVKTSNVSWVDTIHWCEKCEAKNRFKEVIEKVIIEQDLQVEMVGTAWKRSQGRKCFECGQEMFEYEMGKLPAILGGTYPGICPHCKVESRPFGKPHEITNKFKMVKEELK